MGEIWVASRSRQLLGKLKCKDEYVHALVVDEVEELVKALEEIDERDQVPTSLECCIRLLNKEKLEKKNMNNFRNLVYAIEDALETWVVGVEEALMPSMNEKKINIIRLLRRCFGRRNENRRNENLLYVMLMFIRTYALEVMPFIDRYRATVPDDALIDADRRAKKSTEGKQEHFIDREKDFKEVVQVVTDQDKNHRVVSICGAKGLGKTSLAKKVYQDLEVIRKHFDAFAWVRLRQDDQIDDGLLQSILNQLVKKSDDEKKDYPAQIQKVKQKGQEAERKEGAEMDQLENILKHKKCFIVFDGILESSQWQHITSKLLIKDAYTKFLLTTENEQITGDEVRLHKLCLTEDEGWELLKKYAFRGKNAPDLGLMPRLGKEIVKKCCEFPSVMSTLSTLGRILSEKSSSNEWHEVNDDIERYLKEADESESYEAVVHNNRDPTSYADSLPYHAKQCVFYLAIFKKDEGVDPEDLSFLWIAERMFYPETLKEGHTENYVVEFANMLNVHVDELSRNISLSDDARHYYLDMGVKEDFDLKVVDFSGGKQPRFDPYALDDGTRRLVIHFNKTEQGRYYLEPTDYLRSLLFLNSDRECVCLPVAISDSSKFTLVRILHFVRCKFEGRKLPEWIWKLRNLRYFGLLYCDLDQLPAPITKFTNLQVLNVRSYDDSKMIISNDIFKSGMDSLKHVRLPHYSDDNEQRPDKMKLDKLHNLETLDGFNADIHDIDSVSELKKLRHLSTYACSNESLLSIIKLVNSGDAEHIETKLLIEHKCNLASPEGMPVLEEVLMSKLNALTFSMVAMNTFPNCGKLASEHLTQMKLIGCKLSEDPMEALGKFPKLGKLWLAYGAFVGKTIAITEDGGFPNLEYLEFRCLPKWEEWRVRKGAMKKLSTLIVSKCPKFKKIPHELTSLTCLKNMEIELPDLLRDQKKTYHQMFKFVPTRTIRKLETSAGSSSAR